VNDGVAADRITSGKETAQDGQAISKEKGVAVRIADVFGLNEKRAASLQTGFRVCER
jgi:hypothetical protein